MGDKPATTKFARSTLAEAGGMLYNLAQEAEASAEGFDEREAKLRRYERSVERAVAEAEMRGMERAAKICEEQRTDEPPYIYNTGVANCISAIHEAARSQNP